MLLEREGSTPSSDICQCEVIGKPRVLKMHGLVGSTPIAGITTKRGIIMSVEKWIVTYDVRKVNGDPYRKPKEMIAEHAQNIPRMIQRAAETLRERYDFGAVTATATSVEDANRHFSFIAEAEAGFRNDWTP